MFEVGFELVSSTMPNVRALVRWATGKRLTNRLPKLSLITSLPNLSLNNTVGMLNAMRDKN